MRSKTTKLKLIIIFMGILLLENPLAKKLNSKSQLIVWK